MSHKLEGILALVRTYQLPFWMYSPHEEFNPYLLSSVGFRPVAKNLLQCSICSKEIVITEHLEENPKEMLQIIRIHEQNCIYNNQEPAKITKEQLYLSMDEIINEMDINKNHTVFPLLNRASIMKCVGANTFLFKKILNLYEINFQQFKITFMLKMFGWYLNKNEDDQQCLNCYFCGRNIPLSKFQTVSQDKQNPEVQSIHEERLFDPINQHRYFCFITNKEQNWLVYLQHLENKYSESCSFNFKTTPYQSQRMRLHINKYIQGAKEKIQTALLKLKALTHQCGLLCSQIGQDKVINLQAEEQEGQLKRFRDHEQSIQLLNEHLVKQLTNPLKKIKFT